MGDELGTYDGHSVRLNAPICSLSRRILQPLCIYLSGEQRVYIEGIGGDWKTLGSYLHLPVVMEERIEEYARGKRTTPAFVLLDLWDNGIKKNPGTIKKLIIALHQSGMAAYLNQHILAPLQAAHINTEGVNDMLKSLQPDIRERLFPVLDLNDIEWDKELESKCLQYASDEEEEKAEPRPVARASIIPNSVYVSHYTNSSSNKYRTQVKNIVRTLEQRGHTVWCDSSRNRHNLHVWKERCIQSAATIIVVYNKDYQKAHEAFINEQKLPACVEVDIPMIHHLSFSTRAMTRLIIPVIIDVCKTKPSEIPFWLATKMPKVFYPSEEEKLLHIVQRIPRIVVPRPTSIHHVTPQVLDVESIRRQYLQQTAH